MIKKIHLRANLDEMDTYLEKCALLKLPLEVVGSLTKVMKETE